MRNELLYIEEHVSCQSYTATTNTGFKYIDFGEETEFGIEDTNKNHLLFFLEGDFTINCNQFHNRIFRAGDMILIPRSAYFKGIAKGKARVLFMFFDNSEWYCDRLTVQSLSTLCNNKEYTFEPVKIRYPLTSCIELLTYCIRNKMNSSHLYDLMQQEFFLLLQEFYKKQEIAMLFYPLIGKEIDFKDFVMRNYAKVSNIEQLISLSNMGRSRFFTKFNEIFGMTAKQWMLKQKNRQILKKMAEPCIYIKDVAEELGFDSQAYFSRYCKHHFGCTPSQLMKHCQTDNEKVTHI